MGLGEPVANSVRTERWHLDRVAGPILVVVELFPSCAACAKLKIRANRVDYFNDSVRTRNRLRSPGLAHASRRSPPPSLFERVGAHILAWLILNASFPSCSRLTLGVNIEVRFTLDSITSTLVSFLAE